MSILSTYQFTNASNFALSNTQIDSNAGKLALVPNSGQMFSQDFSSSTGFTFDSALAEFVAGVVRQKDKTAAGSRLAATYASTLNSNWNKDAAVTATLNGVPTLSGGKLSCINALRRPRSQLVP